MNILKNYIHIGVDEPFCVLHASDTHLTLCDERNDERKQELAASLQIRWKKPSEILPAKQRARGGRKQDQHR